MATSNDGIQRWNRAAPDYVKRRGMSGGLIFEMVRKPMLDWLGPLKGQRIVDLGCGHGWLCKLLADDGADVTGVDGAPNFLAVARRAYPDLTFIEHDLTDGLPIEGPVDAIVSHMVLCTLDDVDVLLRSARAALRPSGRLICTINHPCFFGTPVIEREGRKYRGINGYLTPRADRNARFGGTPHYRRSLSFYFDAFHRAGFDVGRLIEPQQTFMSFERPPWARPIPEHGGRFWRDIPMLMLIEAIPATDRPLT